MHLDDEIYRVLVRLGIAEQFAAVSRPTRGLQLIDRNHRVFAVFDRAETHGRHGHPQANMFDQPELEQLLRTNLKDQTTVSRAYSGKTMRVVRNTYTDHFDETSQPARDWFLRHLTDTVAGG